MTEPVPSTPSHIPMIRLSTFPDGHSDRTRGGLDPISVVINDVIAEFSHHHYDPMIKKKSLFPIVLRTNDYQIFFLALPGVLSITFHMIHISAKLRIDKRVHG